MKTCYFVSTLILLWGCSSRPSGHTENVQQKPADTVQSRNLAKVPLSDTVLVGDTTLINECYYTGLSDTYDFTSRIVCTCDSFNDRCHLILTVTDRQTQQVIDHIRIASDDYYQFVFLDCEECRSVTTGKNKNREIADNYAGDLVVGDFNFDSLEDIALIRETGGNGGPLYDFYLQDTARSFTLDPFLSDSVAYYPSDIRKTGQTLTTTVHAGACYIEKNTYRLKKGKWKTLSSQLIDVCND